MILAIDVHYKPDAAKVVCAVLQHWNDRSASHHWIKYVKNVAPYIPGAFYKRELPCMLEILEDVDFTTIECIIIDGFVVLDDTGKPGLGMHLYENIQQQVPVIGVAKSSFHQNTKHVVPVLRGESKKPLFVTAVGMDCQQAANNILNMHGKYRIPDVLKELDRKTKEE